MGVLDVLGGPLLTNLASLAGAVVLLVGLERLLRREGVGAGRRWAVALVAANPWFVVAATSTTDYVIALAFVVLAANALRDHRPWLAGFLAALAMGCRIGSAAWIAALLLAELLGRRTTTLAAARDEGYVAADPRTTTPTSGGRPGGGEPTSGSVPAIQVMAPTTVPGPPGWLIAGLVAAAGTALLFLPSLIEAGGLEFAQNDFSTSAPLVHLGRALVKDLTLLGLLGTLVLLAALPAVAVALRRWSTSWLVRFGALGFGLSQLLFLRFPWKMPHLLPCLLGAAIVLAVALDRRPRLLVALAALQVLFAVVQVQVVRPDNPDRATGAEFGFWVDWGPVVQDWRCRRDHPDAYLGRQKVEVEAAWTCATPFGD